ncbi:MAG TPA: hypothetical protein VED01_21880 [Burkholderiales bacterium]|nr:hypothetical protein [Burkholderiales bacterium]
MKMLKALVEVAAVFMLGQGLLYVLAGRRKHENFVYQLFAILTRPVFRITRAVTPRFVRDDHIPIAAFLLLFWLWIGLLGAKAYLCVGRALACD